MQFSQNIQKVSELKFSHIKLKNKTIKTQSSISKKSSIKNTTRSSSRINQQFYQFKDTNYLIKQKYYRPGINQYEKSDANTITRCINKDFQSSQSSALNLYQFLIYNEVKQYLQKYQQNLNATYKDKVTKVVNDNKNDAMLRTHLFHFYQKPFEILRNRRNKIRNLNAQYDNLKSQKTSSVKKDKKNTNSKPKLKNKNKLNNTDNLLNGLFLNKKEQKSLTMSNIKNIQKNQENRKTHILSKDSQQINNLVEQLGNLLKTCSVENYHSKISQFTIQSSKLLPFNISSIECQDKSQLKQLKQRIKNNEFTQIMENQYSHISAIKSSQISNPDQYEFYGLSAIKQKKIKKNLQNSHKDNSYLFNKDQIEASTNQSRATNKKISTNFQSSNIFSEQTPKKICTNRFISHKDQKQQTQKSKSGSKTLRKGLKQKSKSKSLQQKSLKKNNIIMNQTKQYKPTNSHFKIPKILSVNARNTIRSQKSLQTHLYFPQILRQDRLNNILETLKSKQNIKDRQVKKSKSKSKQKSMNFRK